MTEETEYAAAHVLDAMRARGLKVATAESCTGGLLAAALVDVPGSSDVLDRGFVTYSNAAKSELLGVPPGLIETHGAVSEAVVRAMAEGALKTAPVDVTIAVTGVAGPGGTEAKPEGLVWFACARHNHDTVTRERRFGPLGRNQVRSESVAVALAMLLEAAR